MHNLFEALPPIPILFLFILILAWIAPVLVANFKRADLDDGPKTKVETAGQWRTRFYWALVNAGIFAMLFLKVNPHRSTFERTIWLPLFAVWVLQTVRAFRRWRQLDANTSIDNPPEILSGRAR